jgi:hypothetical protein
LGRRQECADGLAERQARSAPGHAQIDQET